MKKCKLLNVYKKILSLTLIFMLMISCFQFQTVHADYEYEQDGISILSAYANEVKPQINVNYLGATPESPMVGQDITLRYEIDPLPFYHNTSGKKEIVLVLDVSGSMGKEDKLTNLKTAASQFIEKLTETTANKKTPRVTSLSIGIVTFSDYGTIESYLEEVTTDSEVVSASVNKLKRIISNLDADGGTNTGDGLRKGAYLLANSNGQAHKSIIFMADGEPTYYSYNSLSNNAWMCSCTKYSCGRDACTSNNRCTATHGENRNTTKCGSIKQEYYTTLDNKSDMRKGGNGSSDNGRPLKYATAIGKEIAKNKYNVFTIGYGLGEEDSNPNKKMKNIHQAMGGVVDGENKTFFASDAGAIDKVFESIADTLIKSYTIGEVDLNIDLGDTITPISGFEVSDGNGGKIAMKPIIYTRNENNQYTAEKQYIEIVVRAEKEGNIPILKSSSILSYKDIEGKTQQIAVVNGSINVRPFSVDEVEKLSVDFKSIPDGYLIGDVATGKVTFTRNTVDGITYTDGKFTLNEKPNNLSYEGSSSSVLNFGTISSTVNKDYKFKINNDEEITRENEAIYTLSGTYNYILNKANNKEAQSGDKTAILKVKRGLIKAKVFDEGGNDITEKTTLYITSSHINKTQNTMDGEYAVFDTVSSGDYIVGIESVPDGCTIPEVGNSTVVRVDYNSNVVTIEFTVKGEAVGDTDIISHGVYLNGDTSKPESMLLESEDSSIRLTEYVPTTLGVLLDVSGKNNEINLTANEGAINYNKIKVYEITESGLSKIEAIAISSEGIKLGEISSGKCLILYEYTPTRYTSNATLTASVKNTNKSKALKLKFRTTTLFNLF